MRRRGTSTIMIAVLAVLVSGCAVVSGDASLRSEARQAVRDVARAADAGVTSDLDEWTRRIWTATENGRGASVELIGVEALGAADLLDRVGRFSFAVTVVHENVGFFSGETRRLTACFRVDFSGYGPVGSDGRTSYEADEVVADAACPDPIAPVVPPVDESIVSVIPDDAEEVVIEVLTTADDAADAAQIEQRVSAEMSAPSGVREVAFEPEAFVDDAGDIGFAMGDAGTCLLVRRLDGVVERVYAPSVYLQPGELGCRATTALADLRPPH
jgi:hypothetical protein